jgi:hypothetical protein
LKIIKRYCILFSCLCFAGCSCNQKKLNPRVSLWRLDKIPYGTKYAFDNLPFIFPNAEIRTSTGSPDLDLGNHGDDTSRALVVISPQFVPEPYKMNSIIRFAAAGNQVFISAFYFRDTLLQMLKLTKNLTDVGETDRTEMSLLDPVKNEWVKFSYPGRSFNAYFTSIDTGHTTILGRNINGEPNFIRLSYPHGGAVFVHLNPLAFSNFFLLHKKNKSYYDIALSYMPVHTIVVEWSDFFRYNYNAENFSSFRFIIGNRSLRWAFWLTLILFALLFLVESKRKQRPIPELPGLRNASEDFVKTVGRLYFQQKNNQNLAAKMVNAFLENIRSVYHLPTSALNEEFAQKLAIRTGRRVDEVMQMFRLIQGTRINTDITDEELMELNQQINQFTKPA